MIGCQVNCPKELKSQDAASFGVVEDEEQIVRAALSPRHVKSQRIKAALIPKNHLFEGHLSVWRYGGRGIPHNALVERLGTVPDQELFALCGLKAGQIRGIKVGTSRALSVVDECECDRDGGKHEAHAHIALCKTLIAAGMSKEDALFEQTRQELYALFKSNAVTTDQPDSESEGSNQTLAAEPVEPQE